jgi:dihydroxy-acid dehydratase
MEAKADLKARLPSRHVTEGPERTPDRRHDYATGLTTEQIFQPFVGVESCGKQAAPCNIAMMHQAQAAKDGVASAGSTPREFCTMTVTNGIARGYQGMNSSLPSREHADSIEPTMRGHADDAPVGLVGRDKSFSGMMMAMCRLNVPAIFSYGGSIRPGTFTFKGRAVTVQDVFKAIGRGAMGGPIGLLRDGDVIELDAGMGLVTVKLSDEELTNRKREWKPRSSEFTSRYLWKYAQQVGPARNGAVTHPGGGAETSGYADI